MNWAGAALTEALSIAAVSSGSAVRSRFSEENDRPTP